VSKNLEALFLTHGQELQAFLTRRLRDPHTAADLLQETFLRFATGAPQDQVVNPRAFLYRIASNLAVDCLRQDRARAKHVEHGGLPEEVACAQPSADEVLAGREELAILAAAVEELPAKCRQVFLLYRGRGLSMREIAASLGITQKTVENHIAKAMVHCRRRLQAAGRRA
jgi:RNA polymerase sigma-70 factor (ECF subfamily)